MKETQQNKYEVSKTRKSLYAVGQVASDVTRGCVVLTLLAFLTGWAANMTLDTLEKRDQKRMKNQFSSNYKKHNK